MNFKNCKLGMRIDFMASQENKSAISPASTENTIFTGHIYIFHAFDVGDDISLGKVQKLRSINNLPLNLPKYFKNYHVPLNIELPHPNDSARCTGVKIYNFGGMSLTYKIPFKDSLENLRKEFSNLYDQYREQSFTDARLVYSRIEGNIKKPHFFVTNAAYIVIQVDPQPGKIDAATLKTDFGALIASTLRFETQTLSEAQKNDILEPALGYFRGDLIVVDIDAAFVCDPEYEEILDLFEFANIQYLELQYFDRLLDQQLNRLYEDDRKSLPLKSYLPFVETDDKVRYLSRLKVDISVITERLENSIKLAGEPYFTELYELLIKKLELREWKASIDRKLNIIRDVQDIYQHQIDSIREDILTVLIIILIFVELIVGVLLHYMK
jgi:hypothetical protein